MQFEVRKIQSAGIGYEKSFVKIRPVGNNSLKAYTLTLHHGSGTRMSRVAENLPVGRRPYWRAGGLKGRHLSLYRISGVTDFLPEITDINQYC